MLIAIHGLNVYNKYREMLSAATESRRAVRGSEALPDAQIALSRAGFIEATIVRSLYGYDVRYASGIYEWGLIYSSRGGQLNGTLEDAMAKAGEWQRIQPHRRFVTISDGIPRASA